MPTSLPLDVYRCPLVGTSLIEASAGTGKTWAICGLVLRLLVEKGYTIDQVLVVTFTNAATAELRERVRARLVEVLAWLEGERVVRDPFIAQFVATLEGEQGLTQDAIRLPLKAALAAFDEASIFTIHGFCQRALGDSPFAAGQPFALELGDGTALVREVVTDYWRQRIAHGNLDPGFIRWLLGRGFSPEQLQLFLSRHLKKPLAQALWPSGLETLAPLDTRIDQAVHAQAAQCWREQRAAIIDVLRASLADLKYFDEGTLATGARGWDDYFAAANLLAPLEEKAAQFRFVTLRDKKTKKGKAPPEHPFFYLAEALCTARDDQETLLELHRLALFRDFLAWAPGAVATRKRERHQVDFDDLLQNLHRALSGPRGPALAAALGQRYPAALIDEFQDTDPLQFAIFQAIYGPGAEVAHPVFLVGDPKQAIYSFRQADLHTYLEARNLANAHYYLEANQRSSGGVIAGINGLFRANARAFMLPGLDFQPTRRGEKPLKVFFDGTGVARAPLHGWQLPDGEDLLLRPEAFAAAAEATAGEIARLLQGARQGLVTLDDQPLTPGRVAILVRTHKQGRLMRQALSRVGLRAAELSQASVLASGEAEDLERLLAALLEPARGPLLRAALATPLLGLSADGVAALNRPEGEAELAGWVAQFQQWHQRWQGRGIAVALGELGESLNIHARLLALPEGERRLTNHLHLVELLHQASGETPQPARLLRNFSCLRQAALTGSSGDEAAQLRLESDRDLVNIVTIHKAKGLEYDLVFCPFLWEGGLGSRRDSLPGVTYHDAQGKLVIDYRDEDAAAPGRAEASLAQAAEILRLYYVALTRSVQRCYLVWGPYGKATRGDKPSRTESRKTLLNWLLAGGGTAPAGWLEKGGDEAAIAAAWSGLVKEGEGHVALEPLPRGCATPLAPLGEAPHFVPARCSRYLRPGWRIGSFTGLLQGARLGPESGGADHDALVHHAALAFQAQPLLPEDDFLLFPRGPRAGDCVHQMFEKADFTDPATWPGAIAAALVTHPPGEPAQRELHGAMLAGLLGQLVSTPLLPAHEPPLCLQEIGPRRRLVEMEFHLPATQLQAQALQNLLEAHGEALPQLEFQTFQGYLKGYIDLVFEHQGRYYVLDWKTNHLGWKAEDYGPAALDLAMLEHGYRLQAHLYLLALHRHLARRLPDYNPARHLGGALYLFVRGVRPDWQLAAGPSGVCHLPTRPALLAAMDKLLAGP